MRITPRKTPRGMHSAPNPGVLVIHGSYRGFPLNCPGIGSIRQIFTAVWNGIFFGHRTYAVVVVQSSRSRADIPVFPIQPGECDLFIVSRSLAA